jgi:hypothetical protein
MFATEMKPHLSVLRNVGIIAPHNHRRGKKWWVIWMLLILATHSSGTSVIIAYSFDNVVFLAADSLQADAITGNTRLICKVKKSNDMYWAAATDYLTYGNTGFDLSAIVESIGAEGTINSKMARFIKAVTYPLQRAMEDSKKRSPKVYAKMNLSKATPLQIVFVAIEDGKPTFAITTFLPHLVRGRITLSPEPYSRSALTPTQGLSITGLGSYTLVLDYLKTRAPEMSIDPVSTIRNAMRLEVAGGRVSEPFSILRFDSNGPIWADHGECK